MEILDKARELGQMLAESEEMHELNSAGAEVRTDEKASTLLNEVAELQHKMHDALTEEESREAIEALNKELQAKQREFSSNDVAKRYMQAKDGFDRLLKEVNNAVMQAMTGESSCSSGGCSSEGCSSDDCGSCGCSGSCG